MADLRATLSSLDAALGGESRVRRPEEVISALIAFANGDSRPDWSTRTYEVNGRFGVYGRRPRDAAADGLYSKAQAEVLAERQIDLEKRIAIAMLTAATAGVDRLIDYLFRHRGRIDFRDIRLRPIAELRKAGDKSAAAFELTWEFDGPRSDSHGWVRFAAAAIASGKAASQETDIGRCKLETCQRFFEIKRGELGKVRRYYCSPEHRLEQHTRESAERQRRSRAAKKSRTRRPK